MTLPMEVDSDNDLLSRIASGELPTAASWPALRTDILARLDKIAHNDFSIPNLPPPVPPPQLSGTRLLSSLPSSPPQTPPQTNKESKPVRQLPSAAAKDEGKGEGEKGEKEAALQQKQQQQQQLQPLKPGDLPGQLADMLEDITRQIGGFNAYPPHTIQRLAELVLHPRMHYMTLASYFHAVDRVVQVTSRTNTYPLPLPIPDMSSIHLNGSDNSKDPAKAVSWSNQTMVAVGSDEALGGALLTPIPWLTRGSPESNGGERPGAQIHSESTETIDGPNGMGSIETVSVSVNGVPSTGHTRGVTQGELLRQEQRAGVVPVSQLSRNHEMLGESGGRGAPAVEEDQRMKDEEEIPHARGPEEIGVNDTGPQSATTSYIGGSGVEMQGIDLEAAVGRKHDEAAPRDGRVDETAPPKSPGAESMGSKREADESLEGDTAPKKAKENAAADETAAPRAKGPETDRAPPEASGQARVAGADDDADKMETT